MLRQIQTEQIMGAAQMLLLENGKTELALPKLYQLEKLVDAAIREHNNAMVSFNQSLHNLFMANSDILDFDEDRISLKDKVSIGVIYSRFVKGTPKDIQNTIVNTVRIFLEMP